MIMKISIFVVAVLACGAGHVQAAVHPSLRHRQLRGNRLKGVKLAAPAKKEGKKSSPGKKPLECGGDGTCMDDGLYCSTENVCLPHASCLVDDDCFLPENQVFYIDCVGAIDCDQSTNQCRKTCDTVQDACPDGLEPAPCAAAPCSVAIPCPAAVRCENYYCGECTARFYDAQGERVCTTPEEYCEDESCPNPCASATCITGTRCIADTCNGNCRALFYDDEGTLVCGGGDGGGKGLDPEICPDGQSPVECENEPCSLALCPRGQICRNDYCGGCNAICEDDNGGTGRDPVLCEGAEDCDGGTCVNGVCLDPDNSECGVSEDCGDAEQYCATGRLCLPLGTCNVADDCVNKDNFSPADDCEGGTVEAACDRGTRTCSYQCRADASCKSGRDCDSISGEYCASGQCTPPGGCKVDADCFNPSNEYSLDENDDCRGEGFIYCDVRAGLCKRSCSNNNNGPCPAGLPQVRCFAPPCEVTKCDGECVDNYCGGCNAIVFAPDGTQVCGQGVYPLPTCEETSECKEGEEYCSSSGRCLPYQSCSSAEDCSNEDNAASYDDCVGSVDCNLSAMECQKTCFEDACALADPCREAVECRMDENGNAVFFDANGDPACLGEDNSATCPDGSKPFNCLVDPCSYSTCVEGTRCVSDFCGGCRALFYDENDNLVCESGNNDGPPPKSGCDSSKDCVQGKEYCSVARNCLPFASCDELEDCTNPENQYATIQCVGERSCRDNQCHVDC